MKKQLKIFLPMVILISGAGVAWQLYANSPKAVRTAVIAKPPSVRVVPVKAQDIRIPVITHGTVKPRTSIPLAAQISGKIIMVSESFANGGFFSKGEVLVTLDSSDYELAITKAEALVASANQQLSRAEAEYKQAQNEISGLGKPMSSVSAYALRKPQLEEGKANLKAANADLAMAKLHLQRTVIVAPFDGRVLTKQADVGQYITPGLPLANIYATDIAEVRLPIAKTQAGLLDLPLEYDNKQSKRAKAKVQFFSQHAGVQYSWDGYVERTEGGVDERNRMLYVVARIPHPYTQDRLQPNRPPMDIGMFIEAHIEGKLKTNTVVLPRGALRGIDHVWIVDDELRLQIRKIDLLFRGLDQIYVRAGLNSGDRIIVSPLDLVVEGMKLDIVEQDLDQVLPTPSVPANSASVDTPS